MCPELVAAAAVLLVLAASTLNASDASFSDPSKLPQKEGRLGYPSRNPKLDVLPGFKNPPAGYGEVPFYWWIGDKLTKERLSWQLEQLKGKGVTGLQVNYCHTDKGGNSWGLSFPSDPPIFAKEWWDLYTWWAGECGKQGISVSLSDYTLASVGQGFWSDEILAEDPTMRGSVLEISSKDFSGPGRFSTDLPANFVGASAVRMQGDSAVPNSVVDLRPMAKEGKLEWDAPEGTWKVFLTSSRVVQNSLDPLNPKLGPKVIEKFFQRFENHLPGQAGKGLDFFFSDELDFGIRGNLWHKRFPEEFKKRKGYDIVPMLPAVFTDIGPATPKIRMDYYDVMVALEEESYFEPVFKWHNDRGMVYGCDHGGRGQDVTEFGDYFRTQRWMTGPGCDQPQLDTNVVKNKVAASISHLYQRPRVWLEGFHSSGWGTSTADITRATLANFASGQNLLSLHGLYYTTHGGWWEWAPPCNHFRMPYWEHMDEWMKGVQRLSYIMSQGVHRCDIAIVYPVAAKEAGMDVDRAVGTAFGLGRSLYDQGIDFDFIDFQSLERAQIKNGQIQVSGEAYKVLIIPAMAGIRQSTVDAAAKLFNAGGLVVAGGTLPYASDRAGRDDAKLDAEIKAVFGQTAQEAREGKPSTVKSTAGGTGAFIPDSGRDADGKSLPELISTIIQRDLIPSGRCDVNHRKIGNRDVYFVYGAEKNSEIYFNARGKVELWDLWTGQTTPLYAVSESKTGTTVRMPLTSTEAQIIVFSPGSPDTTLEKCELDDVIFAGKKDTAVVVEGYSASPGEKSAVMRRGGKDVTVKGSATAPVSMAIDGPWEFELKPTMDNRFGDFRIPATNEIIGAEARRFKYADETSTGSGWQDPSFDDSGWKSETASFGPRFWRLGPVSSDANTIEVEAALAQMKELDPSKPVIISGKEYRWQPYEFSMRWGIEGMPEHQGYHGLKENVGDNFIGLGRARWASWEGVFDGEDGGSLYYLWTSAYSPKDLKANILAQNNVPSAVYLNGQEVGTMQPPDRFTGTVDLKAGQNPMLLRYQRSGRGSFILQDIAAPKDFTPFPLAMSWYNRPGVVQYDATPGTDRPAGWYRFTAPPGLTVLKFSAFGKVQGSADGKPLQVTADGRNDDGSTKYEAVVAEVKPGTSIVALRVQQERGRYGGSAIPEPISLTCTKGSLEPGDWSKIGVLENYSGGAWYRRTVTLPAVQAGDRVMLDLGNVVSSAEVRVNGKPAGIRFAPPWKLDISKFVKPGENRIEVLVYNTLSNQYVTIPTAYRGSLTSGLLGPVKLEISKLVVLK